MFDQIVSGFDAFVGLLTFAVLSATLFLVWRYTASTRKLAQYAEDQFRARLAPVVTVEVVARKDGNIQPGDDALGIKLTNVSDNHADVRAEVDAVCLGSLRIGLSEPQLGGEIHIFVQARSDRLITFALQDVLDGFSGEQKERIYRILSNDQKWAKEVHLARLTGGWGEWGDLGDLEAPLHVVGGLAFEVKACYRRWSPPGEGQAEQHELPRLRFSVMRRHEPGDTGLQVEYAGVAEAEDSSQC